MSMTIVADANLVKSVQQQLLALGYSSVNAIDGELGVKTQAAILNFRNQNGLPLTPNIDNQLVLALQNAPKTDVPAEQTTATASDIAPKVEAVHQNAWGKFWAKIVAIPSFMVTLLIGIVNNLGDAVNALTPFKTFISDWVQGIHPVTVIMISSGVVAAVSGILWMKSKQTENAMVAGYQIGSLHNDNKEAAQ